MEPDADLTAVLGATPPATISALPAKTQERLSEQIAAAKQQLEAETDRSVKAAIAGVPMPVRGIVRKALLG